MQVEIRLLQPPTNTNLPFFAYGIFKKGEISFLAIKQFVKDLKANKVIKAKLYVKDGVSLIDITETDSTTYGDIIYFKDAESALNAYNAIGLLEPTTYYEWGETEIDNESVNVLIGRNINKGTNAVEDNYWDSWIDPLFTTIFEIIDEVLKEPTNDISGKQFLKLQMTYLLLWTAIERYVTLRYKIGGSDVVAKVNNLIYEVEFLKGIKRIGIVERKVHKSHESGHVKFDVDNPKNCVSYFYQIRSNIAHRGKAIFEDAKLVHFALAEMSFIFKRMLEQAKIDADKLS